MLILLLISVSDDNINQSKPSHPLDLIYDMNSFNKVLLQKKLSSLAEFDDFLQYSSRNVVLIHYISLREVHELTVMKGDIGERIAEGFREDSIVDCREHLSGYRIMLEEAINSEVSEQLHISMGKFHIIKYWCVNMSVFSTPEASAEKMEFASDEDATIIVVNWRGLGNKQVIKGSVKGTHKNNRVAMLKICEPHTFTDPSKLIAYSPLIEQTAQKFAATLNLKEREKLAVVHLRSEKLGLREPRMPGVTTVCFRKLMRMAHDLAMRHPSTRFVYITDYGPYSSDTCRRCRGSKDVKKFLQRRNITPLHFEPSHFNITNDTGLAAAVESQFISSANFLFLCGGGGYQNQIATRFLMLKHRQSKLARTEGNGRQLEIFRVCSDDDDIQSLFGKVS